MPPPTNTILQRSTTYTNAFPWSSHTKNLEILLLYYLCLDHVTITCFVFCAVIWRMKLHIFCLCCYERGIILLLKWWLISALYSVWSALSATAELLVIFFQFLKCTFNMLGVFFSPVTEPPLLLVSECYARGDWTKFCSLVEYVWLFGFFWHFELSHCSVFA